MKTAWAIVTIAISCAAGHPVATSMDMPFLRHAPSFARAPLASQDTGMRGMADGKAPRCLDANSCSNFKSKDSA